MKRILGIILLQLYIIALIQPVLPILNYSINKSNYILEYCQDKLYSSLFCGEDCTHTVQFHCDGKCHLSKELKSDTDQSNSPYTYEVDLNKFPYCLLVYHAVDQYPKELIQHRSYYKNRGPQIINNIEPEPPRV